MPKENIDRITVNKEGVNFELNLFNFKEDGLFVVYSEALDLYGYGDTKEAAEQSFNDSLSLYFDHTTEFDTLSEDLQKMGWSQSQYSKKKFKRPQFDLSQIMQTKGIEDYQTMELAQQF